MMRERERGPSGARNGHGVTPVERVGWHAGSVGGHALDRMLGRLHPVVVYLDVEEFHARGLFCGFAISLCGILSDVNPVSVRH